MKTCTKCGLTRALDDFYRHASSLDGLKSWCKTCARAYSRRYYASHREKCKAQSSSWAARNPESRDASMKRYHAANPNRTSEWRRDNPEKFREQLRRAKIRRRSREEVLPGAPTRAEIIDRDGVECYLCGRTCTDSVGSPRGSDLTLDHVVPLARGGEHSADNLRVACHSCNARKGVRLLEELNA